MPWDKKGVWTPKPEPPSEANLWGKKEYVEGHRYTDANGRAAWSRGYYRMVPESRRRKR